MWASERHDGVDMSPWEYAYARSIWARESTIDPAQFLTAEERAKLSQVQAQFQGRPDCVELELDECRLSFACWLVDRGLISED